MTESDEAEHRERQGNGGGGQGGETAEREIDMEDSEKRRDWRHLDGRRVARDARGTLF